MMYSSQYWSDFYENDNIGWDIGYISTPIKEYIDQIQNKNLKILIPGAGNAYEAEYLYHKGFSNVFLLEYAGKPISNFLSRVPDFPKSHILQEDFFLHKGKYDLIIEQTFFSSIKPDSRPKYVRTIHDLLATDGKLVGLLFNIDFHKNYPPFGGNKDIYIKLFAPLFEIETLETAYNSIKPRMNNELFIKFKRK